MGDPVRDRHMKAAMLRDEGKTYSEIGEVLGVSKRRAQQMVIAGRRPSPDRCQTCLVEIKPWRNEFCSYKCYAIRANAENDNS